MKTKTFLVAAMLILSTLGSLAQENEKRLGVEINGGASFPTNELAGSDLTFGGGFEVILQCRLLPFTSVYGGWGWNQLSADESFAGADVDFEETGYVLGLQFRQSIGQSPFAYFVRAGALYNHIETENNNGDIINDTGHGFGWQAAAGVEISLGKNWSLAPGIKYNSLSRDTEFGDENFQLDHRYLSARVGIIKRF